MNENKKIHFLDLSKEDQTIVMNILKPKAGERNRMNKKPVVRSSDGRDCCYECKKYIPKDKNFVELGQSSDKKLNICERCIELSLIEIVKSNGGDGMEYYWG